MDHVFTGIAAHAQILVAEHMNQTLTEMAITMPVNSVMEKA